MEKLGQIIPHAHDLVLRERRISRMRPLDVILEDEQVRYEKNRPGLECLWIPTKADKLMDVRYGQEGQYEETQSALYARAKPLRNRRRSNITQPFA